MSSWDTLLLAQPLVLRRATCCFYPCSPACQPCSHSVHLWHSFRAGEPPSALRPRKQVALWTALSCPVCRRLPAVLALLQLCCQRSALALK